MQTVSDSSRILEIVSRVVNCLVCSRAYCVRTLLIHFRIFISASKLTCVSSILREPPPFCTTGLIIGKILQFFNALHCLKEH
jgi:hypothetical protein